jgi:methyl-accepting chemotaxis protein
MDEVTQQNSALVEENAATAKTLADQSAAMDERVAFFRLDQTAVSAPRPVAAAPRAAAPRAPAAAPKRPAPAPKVAPKSAATNGGGPARRMQTALATAVQADPDWKEF